MGYPPNKHEIDVLIRNQSVLPRRDGIKSTRLDVQMLVEYRVARSQSAQLDAIPHSFAVEESQSVSYKLSNARSPDSNNRGLLECEIVGKNPFRYRVLEDVELR